MIAVIFEVVPAPGRKSAYLDLAGKIRADLEEIDGFISVERFQSLTDETKILSLSFFRDEQAVTAWRTLESHRRAQQAGRTELFQTYRLRMANVLRDYGMDERQQAPDDSRHRHGG